MGKYFLGSKAHELATASKGRISKPDNTEENTVFRRKKKRRNESQTPSFSFQIPLVRENATIYKL